MRNKHLELRRRIEDTKLAITDAELFGSRLYGAVLSDIAESVTHRYRRKCRVLTYWDESPDADVGSTNNRTIKINAANHLTASFPTRKLKDLSLRGLLGHEIGHILYTDFNMASVYTSKLLTGEFYPAEPTGLNAEEEDSLAELRPLLAARDRATLLTLIRAGQFLDNVLEDVYIEGRICEAYPGTFARGIQLNNLRFAETMPTVASQIENGNIGYAIIANLMIQYCKTGDVNNLTREDSEYLDVLVDCLPILDAAMYDDDGRARYAAVNHLLIHLWPYLKELREKAQKELEGGEPGKDFWEDYVQAGVEPPYTEDGDLVLASLRKHYGPSDPEEPAVVLAPALAADLHRYVQLKARKQEFDQKSREADKRMKEALAPVLDAMGTAERATLSKDRVTYTVSYASRYRHSISKENLEKLKLDQPEVYDAYATVSESRTCSVKVKEEAK